MVSQDWAGGQEVGIRMVGIKRKYTDVENAKDKILRLLQDSDEDDQKDDPEEYNDTNKDKSKKQMVKELEMIKRQVELVLGSKEREIEGLKVEKKKFCEALDGVEQLWNNFDKDLKTKDNQIKSKEYELQEKNKVILDFEKKEMASAQLMTAQRKRIEDLTKLRGSVGGTKLFEDNRKLEKENIDLKQKVQQKEKGIEKCKNDFVGLQEKISGFLVIRNKLQERVKTAEQALKDKEQEIKENDEIINIAEQKHQDLSSLLEQRENEIQGLKTKLDNCITYMTKSVNQCKDSIKGLMTASEDALEKKETKLKLLDEKIVKLKNSERSYKANIKILEDACDKFRKTRKERKALRKRLVIKENSNMAKLNYLKDADNENVEDDDNTPSTSKRKVTSVVLRKEFVSDKEIFSIVHQEDIETIETKDIETIGTELAKDPLLSNEESGSDHQEDASDSSIPAETDTISNASLVMSGTQDKSPTLEKIKRILQDGNTELPERIIVPEVQRKNILSDIQDEEICVGGSQMEVETVESDAMEEDMLASNDTSGTFGQEDASDSMRKEKENKSTSAQEKIRSLLQADDVNDTDIYETVDCSKDSQEDGDCDDDLDDDEEEAPELLEEISNDFEEDVDEEQNESISCYEIIKDILNKILDTVNITVSKSPPEPKSNNQELQNVPYVEIEEIEDGNTSTLEETAFYNSPKTNPKQESRIVEEDRTSFQSEETRVRGGTSNQVTVPEDPILKFHVRVTDSVKGVLMSFYKTDDETKRKIHDDSEFIDLCKMFSYQFREEIKDSYLTIQGSLEGLSLTPDNRAFIRAQVQMYFEGRTA